MKTSSNRIVAIDGHDGSGKTTLAKLFAEKMGGKYIRPFADDTGLKLIEYFEKKEYKKVALFGNEMIRKQSEAYKNELLVYDRHWMTVFSLLPESYWDDKMWHPLPPTTLCFSDLKHSLPRLQKRNEATYDEEYHTHYLDLYIKLGIKYDTNILRTDKFDIDECLIHLTNWYTSL